MSFSAKVKEEISEKISIGRHCQIAELAALLENCGREEISEEGSKKLIFQTENEAVVRKYFTLLRKAFNINTEVLIHKNLGMKRGNVYFVEIKSEEDVIRILQGTGLITTTGNVMAHKSCADSLVLQRECCRRAYIRGAFLVSGSISDPQKGYHFEIVSADKSRAEQICEIICGFHMDAKIVIRKKSYVVYVKEGSQIADLLAIMEASIALLSFENVRVMKDMRNSVNRKVNCETANINKTVGAAIKYNKDIRYIDDVVGLESLEKGLQELAVFRLQFPEATLKELGMMLTPRVGKSGVNHRLRKLSAIADELRGSNKEDYYD